MEQWASKQDTIKALIDLDFVITCDDPTATQLRSSNGTAARLYRCTMGWWCVSLNAGDWMAPVVWNGPKADWDKINLTDEFVEFLNKYYPGWMTRATS